jgi:hypothetical protein
MTPKESVRETPADPFRHGVAREWRVDGSSRCSVAPRPSDLARTGTAWRDENPCAGLGSSCDMDVR